MVQIHQIKKIIFNQTKKRVGRGGKRGTYSGRGIKGQKSRAGRKIRPEIRDMIKKIPKRRGYRFKSIKSARLKLAVVNLDVLQKLEFGDEKITPEILVEKGAVKKNKGKIPAIKILGRGELAKKIIVSNFFVSETAAGKIKKAGGAVEK